ncbi:MAG: hypothetical protein LUD22_00825 [Coprobacillus sp.]|nr:hypothetical protein [Coprobacillus sp.]
MHKKKSLVSLLAIIPLLLTSCSSSSVKGLYNYDLEVIDLQDEEINPFVELEAEDIIAMLKAELSFPLFIHDVNCSHCIVANANFREVFESYPATIYRYTYNYSTYEKLNDFDSILFPFEFYTPRVMIIRDGELIVDVASSRVASTSSRLKGSLKSFVKLDNLYRLSLNESFELYNENYNDYILFTYSSSDLDLYNYTYWAVNKKKTPVLFINTDETEEILNETLTKKGLDLSTPNLTSISSSEVENLVNNVDKSAIDEFLKGFK